MHVQQTYGVAERRACRTLGMCRFVQRYQKKPAEDEEGFRKDILRLALRYGRYG